MSWIGNRRLVLRWGLAGLVSFSATSLLASPVLPVLLTPAQLYGRLRSKDFYLLNVHVPYEGHIAGTDGFIPFDQLEAHLAELPADKSKPIVVYCRSGRMSAIASKELVQLGYQQVYDLEGGMNQWLIDGYPLEKT